MWLTIDLFLEVYFSFLYLSTTLLYILSLEGSLKTSWSVVMSYCPRKKIAYLRRLLAFPRGDGERCARLRRCVRSGLGLGDEVLLPDDDDADDDDDERTALLRALPPRESELLAELLLLLEALLLSLSLLLPGLGDLHRQILSQTIYYWELSTSWHDTRQ